MEAPWTIYIATVWRRDNQRAYIDAGRGGVCGHEPSCLTCAQNKRGAVGVMDLIFIVMPGICLYKSKLGRWCVPVDQLVTPNIANARRITTHFYQYFQSTCWTLPVLWCLFGMCHTTPWNITISDAYMLQTTKHGYISFIAVRFRPCLTSVTFSFIASLVVATNTGGLGRTR